MASSYKDNGPQIQAAIRAEMTRRVTACCMLLERHAKELLSVAGTAVRASTVKLRKRDGSTTTLRKGSRIYGASPSKPGTPPHKQTGHLRRSVTYEVTGLIGRVGTNLKYGRWLELGTRIVAARPWLRPALADVLKQIERILTAPMKL
jgi:phage gpG-like protein